MEINEKIGPMGALYIPVGLRRELGVEVKIIPGTGAAIIFRRGLDFRHVLSSLKVIEADLEHRIELQNEENPQGVGVQPGHPEGTTPSREAKGGQLT